MDMKKRLLIRARCRKFAQFCRANLSFSYNVPDEIVDICETDEDTAEALELLRNAGLKQNRNGSWEA